MWFEKKKKHLIALILRANRNRERGAKEITNFGYVRWNLMLLLFVRKLVFLSSKYHHNGFSFLRLRKNVLNQCQLIKKRRKNVFLVILTEFNKKEYLLLFYLPSQMTIEYITILKIIMRRFMSSAYARTALKIYKIQQLATSNNLHILVWIH